LGELINVNFYPSKKYLKKHQAEVHRLDLLPNILKSQCEIMLKFHTYTKLNKIIKS
jgi:hypothetical protein